jgi:hypothetical protein
MYDATIPGELVARTRSRKDCGVDPSSPIHHVVAGFASKRVVAGSAVALIGATLAGQSIAEVRTGELSPKVGDGLICQAAAVAV